MKPYVERSLKQAIREFRANDVFDDNSSQLIKDFKYLIVTLAHDAAPKIKIDSAFESVYVIWSGILHREVNYLNSPLVTRFLEHDLFIGTIHESFNEIIPPTVLIKNGTKKLYDISKNRHYYNASENYILIQTAPELFCYASDSTACTTKSKRYVVNYILSRLFFQSEKIKNLFDDRQDLNLDVKNLEETIQFVLNGTSQEAKLYSLASVIDLCAHNGCSSNPKEPLINALDKVEDLDAVISRMGELFGLHQDTVNSAKIIYELSKDRDAVVNTLLMKDSTTTILPVLG